MKIIELSKRIVDDRFFVKRHAKASDCETVLGGEFIMVADGMVAGAQLDISSLEEFTAVAQWAHFIETDKTNRSSGMPTNSRTFGYMPRRPLGRGDWCAKGIMHEDQPGAAAALSELGRAICGPYQKEFASKYGQHVESCAEIDPAYRLDGVFTSGIVNRDNRLPYHYDAGNINNCWSGMVTFKEGCVGGNLAVPQLGVTIENFNGSLLLFDGQSLFHGVTEFEVAPAGHRVTVVYYSLKRLWECLPFSQELLRARQKRDDMENGYAIELALTMEHDEVTGQVRDETLEMFDMGAIKMLIVNYYALSIPASEQVLLNSVHRAITGLPHLPEATRRLSEKFLSDLNIQSLSREES